MAKQLTIINALSLAALFSLSTCPVNAKDITNEQRNAYEARNLYNKNKSNHENLLTRISQQEKRIAEEQTKLNKLKAEEATAKTELDQSKADLEAKTKALDEVWDLRNQ